MIRILENDRDEDSSIDLTKEVDAVFKSGGWLQKALDFDHRGEQAQMAASVSRSLLRGEHLLFEAGTGVGKSFGLLDSVDFVCQDEARGRAWWPPIPLVCRNNCSGRIFPRSVNCSRKIPNLSELADFKCALLVGRANYLCTTRLRKTMAGQSELFEGGQRDELQRISQWADSEAREGIGRNSRLLPWERSGMR